MHNVVSGKADSRVRESQTIIAQAVKCIHADDNVS